MIKLRPYQERFIADLRAAYAGGAHSVLGVAPCGAGKTTCFSYMARSASQRGSRVGLLVHRTELVQQISDTLRSFQVEHGFIAPGFNPDPLARVQVCSVQTIARRIERYRARPFDFLIVDEAHHAAAGTSWDAVIQAHAGSKVLGVTATPTRLSGEPLAHAFDAMVVGPSTRALIELGALSPYRLYCPPSVDMAGVHRRGGDFERGELSERMDRPTITGDAVGHYLRLARGKRALAFCVSIDHAKHVAAQFQAAGVPSASLDGKMASGDRRATMEAFRRGELLLLTSCDLIGEGLDVPGVEAVILLRPTLSLALALQQVGRGLRPAAGKPYASIIDHVGNFGPHGRHGLPDDEREWSLEGRDKRARAGTEATIPTRLCGKCWAVFKPAPVCPSCGMPVEVEARVVREVEGDLEAVDLDAARHMRRVEQGMARTVEELVKVGQARGYKNPRYWAEMVMRTRGRKRGS